MLTANLHFEYFWITSFVLTVIAGDLPILLVDTDAHSDILPSALI